MNSSRRDALKAGLLGVAACSVPHAFASPATAQQGTTASPSAAKPQPWGKGIEGQRQGDLGNGYFLNPIMAGDYPDPTALKMTTYKSGRPSYWPEPAPAGRIWHLRIVNDRHIVTFYYSLDGMKWTRHALRSEVSGYNVNVADDLASLRPALFASGTGSVRFSNFQYRALA